MQTKLSSTTCVGRFNIGRHTVFQDKLLYLHSAEAKLVFSAISGLKFHPKVHRWKWSHFPQYFERKTTIIFTDINRGYCSPWHLDWLQKYWSCNRGYWCPWHLEWLQKYWSCNWLIKMCEPKGYISLNHLTPRPIIAVIIQWVQARATTMKAITSSENVKSHFSDHFSIIASRWACKMRNFCLNVKS